MLLILGKENTDGTFMSFQYFNVDVTTLIPE
jgi:hypothetical protein